MATLQGLLSAVRAGGSAATLVRGEPGVGKSALLRQLVESASDCQVVRATGVEGEIDLPFAGLQQLCRSIIEGLDRLPDPQRKALQVAFGLAAGDPPDQYLVGLAALTLLSEMASLQPLVCVVDDAQWLDPQTQHVLAFVARRLGADSVALAIASRTAIEQLDGVPALELGGLSAADAQVLLDSVTVGRLDGPIRERFLSETHGNPLALLELPHALTPAEVSSGIVRSDRGSLTGRIEDSFRVRVESLPAETRRLLLLAAAEPVGDPLLLLRAIESIGLPIEAADAAVDAGLIELKDRWTFRHPLVRSAVYRSASEGDRRLAHGVLADVTDEEQEVDRKAWHRALATVAPDEEVAASLERTAARAMARGGLAAAGAFLERSALLTPDPDRRVERSLAAADVLLEAGVIASVDGVLRGVMRDVTELQSLRLDRLRARVSLAREGGDKRATLVHLLEVGTRIQTFDPVLGRAVHVEALHEALFLDPDVLTAAVAVLDSAEAPGPPTPVELVLRGYTRLYADGFPTGTDELRRAMVAIREAPELVESDLATLELCQGTAVALWDLDAIEVLARRAVELARRVGAMSRLPRSLAHLADVEVLRGNYRAAEALYVEGIAIGEAIGSPGTDLSVLDAVAYPCDEALLRIDQSQVRAVSPPVVYDACRAIALVGAGYYERALEAAQRACEGHPSGVVGYVLVEIVEAAVRSGDLARADAAMVLLVERTQLAQTGWALGLEARCRALVSNDDTAEACYQEALDRLAQTEAVPDLARAHLLYGEWLRRAGRRTDAREQLRIAHDALVDIGMAGFAERARRELVATGETARKRTNANQAIMTPQELQIVRMVVDGQTNPEIAGQLFLSPRTVEWHLTRVYGKLGIASRRELRGVVPAARATTRT